MVHTLASMASDRFSSQEYKKDIVVFQNFAWEKSETCYNFLIARFYPEVWLDYNVDELSQQLPQYLNSLKKSVGFGRLLRQAENYLKTCEKQWNTNYKITLTILKELTRFDFIKTFTVFITHPGLKNGCYLGNDKIAWGHHEDWENYTTVYLWHEILHSYFSDTELDHAIISLLTDEELRIGLNRGHYPPFVTHKELFPVMKKLLPLWREYLASKNKNILEFRKKAQLKLKSS